MYYLWKHPSNSPYLLNFRGNTKITHKIWKEKNNRSNTTEAQRVPFQKEKGNSHIEGTKFTLILEKCIHNTDFIYGSRWDDEIVSPKERL